MDPVRRPTISVNLRSSYQFRKDQNKLAVCRREKPIPLPHDLRILVGRRSVEPSVSRLKRRMVELATQSEAPLPSTTGTSGMRSAAQSFRRSTHVEPPLKLQSPPASVEQILNVLCAALHGRSLDAVIAVALLSRDVARETEKHKLLRGYSAKAVARGCMEFAAAALNTKVQFSRLKNTQGYLLLNENAIRDVYNALWLERRKFEMAFCRHGACALALRLPTGPKGNVLTHMTNPGSKETSSKRGHHILRREALKRGLHVPASPSRLRQVESASDETAMVECSTLCIRASPFG